MEQQLNLEELSPYRVRTAWRAVRWIGVKLGLIDPDLLLGSLPEEANQPVKGVDFFYRPLDLDMISPPYPDRATRQLIEILRKNAEIGQEMPFSRLSEVENRVEMAQKAGLSLLPRPENADFWVEALQIASEHLFLARGSQKDPDQGRYGLLGLTDPATAPVAAPLLPEMLMWELFLVDQAVEMLASSGEHLIDKEFRDFYGLLPDETRPILSQARRTIRERVDLDVEEQRALMVVRIQDVLHRSKDALDQRAELMALKLLSQTVGITRAEPDDLGKMFKKIVANVNKERKLEYDAPKQIESSPPSEVSIVDIAKEQTS